MEARPTRPSCLRTAGRTACYALLTATLAAYAAGGAFLLQYLEEHGTRTTKGTTMDRMKNDTAILLATELRQVVPHESTWAKKVYQYLEMYERHLLSSRARGLDRRWTDQGQGRDFGTSLLFSISLITATGPGLVLPQSDLGRVSTVLFTLLGIPLTLSWLMATGHYLSLGLAEIFRLACSSSLDGDVAKKRPSSPSFKRYLSFGKRKTNMVVPVKEENSRLDQRPAAKGSRLRRITKVSEPAAIRCRTDSVPNGKPVKTGWKADPSATEHQTGIDDGNADAIPNGIRRKADLDAIEHQTEIEKSADSMPNGNVANVCWNADSDTTAGHQAEMGKSSVSNENLEVISWKAASGEIEQQTEVYGNTDETSNDNLIENRWRADSDENGHPTNNVRRSTNQVSVRNLEDIHWNPNSDATQHRTEISKNPDPISDRKLADILESKCYSKTMEHYEIYLPTAINEQRTADSASALVFAILLFTAYFAFGSATISVLEEWELTEVLFMNFLMFTTLGPGSQERDEEMQLKSTPYYIAFLILGYCILFMVFNLIYQLVRGRRRPSFPIS